MLTSSTTISAISTFLSNLSDRPLVILDPVMVSTSGHTLLPDDAIKAIKGELLRNVDWVTPNIPEAQRLADSDSEIKGLDDMLVLARKLANICKVPTILLKGGHLSVSRDEVVGLSWKYPVVWDEGDDEGDTVEVLNAFRTMIGGSDSKELVVDVLIEGGSDFKLFVGRRLDSTSTHGTGCTLSAALACAWAVERQGKTRSGRLSALAKLRRQIPACRRRYVDERRRILDPLLPQRFHSDKATDLSITPTSTPSAHFLRLSSSPHLDKG